MKSCTDLEQSKKLTEILPLESADLWWDTNEFEPRLHKHYHQYLGITINPIPCWSLAALIEAMPEILIERVKAQDGYDGYYYFVTYEELIKVPYKKELIDACVEMIVRLKEDNLI